MNEALAITSVIFLVALTAGYFIWHVEKKDETKKGGNRIPLTTKSGLEESAGVETSEVEFFRHRLLHATCKTCRARVKMADQYRHAMWHQHIADIKHMTDMLKVGHNSLHDDYIEFREVTAERLKRLENGKGSYEDRARQLAIEIVQTIGRTP